MGDNVKKLIFTILFLVTVLCSCAKTATANLEGYQKYPMDITAEVSGDEGEAKVAIHIDSPDNVSISYTEPKILSGVCYTRDGKATYMTFGDTKVEITDGKICLGSLAVTDFFTLDAASAKETPEWDDNKKLWRAEYNTDEISCVIYYDKDGLPVEIDGKSAGHAAHINDIEIKYENNKE